MTRTTTARPAILIAAASSLLALAGPALAAPLDDPLPQGKLNVAGTDFASAKAVARVKTQVRRLAFKICVPDGDLRAPMPYDQRQCYNTAMNDGFAQIASRREQALRGTTVNLASAQTDTHPVH